MGEMGRVGERGRVGEVKCRGKVRDETGRVVGART